MLAGTWWQQHGEKYIRILFFRRFWRWRLYVFHQAVRKTQNSNLQESLHILLLKMCLNMLHNSFFLSFFNEATKTMWSPNLSVCPLKWHHVTCDEQVTLSRMLKRLTSATSETGFCQACFLFVLLVSHVKVLFHVVLTFKLRAAFKDQNNSWLNRVLCWGVKSTTSRNQRDLWFSPVAFLCTEFPKADFQQKQKRKNMPQQLSAFSRFVYFHCQFKSQK